MIRILVGEHVEPFIVSGGCGSFRITRSKDYRLWGAASYGDTRKVEALLKKGSYVDHRNRILKQTPLITAVLRGSDHMANYLLDKGAESDIEDRYGKTPCITTP